MWEAATLQWGKAEEEARTSVAACTSTDLQNRSGWLSTLLWRNGSRRQVRLLKTHHSSLGIMFTMKSRLNSVSVRSMFVGTILSG